MALALTACSGSRPPPAPGDSTGRPPSLTDTQVIVFPVQIREGAPDGTDAELAFALESRGSRVDWILPDELRRVLRSSPGLEAPIDGLPVDVFLRAEVERIGDPIFGVLRRLNGLTDAPVALIPIAAAFREGPDGEGKMEVSAALLQTRTGRVLWFGVVEGAQGVAASPAVVATAMDALARAVLGG